MKLPDFLGMTIIATPELKEGQAMVLNPDGTVRAALEGEQSIGVAISINCKHCGLARNEHAPNGKCLFESTTYANDATTTIKIGKLTHVSFGVKR